MPNHAHKGFIPYEKLFDATPSPTSEPALVEPVASSSRSKILHASVVKIEEGFVDVEPEALKRAARGGVENEGVEWLVADLKNLGLGEPSESALGKRIPWDYLVYVSKFRVLQLSSLAVFKSSTSQALGSKLPPPLVSPARCKASGVSFMEVRGLFSSICISS